MSEIDTTHPDLVIFTCDKITSKIFCMSTKNEDQQEEKKEHTLLPTSFNLLSKDIVKRNKSHLNV